MSSTVAPGSIHAVIGLNGAGTSTMFNVLSGVYVATSGMVRFGDTTLTGMRSHKSARLGIARALQTCEPRLLMLRVCASGCARQGVCRDAGRAGGPRAGWRGM